MATKRQKRANGEGSLFKRKDGRFEGKVLVGYINGKPKYKSVIRRTQKEAQAAFEKLKRQHAAGINIAPERQTVATFLERGLTDVIARRCRPTTLDMYRHNVRRITKHIGHLQLAKVSPQHVQALLNALGNDGYASATVDRARDVLINAFKTAVKWQLVPRNVAAETEPPKVERYVPRVLSHEQAQAFLAAIQDDRLEAIYRVGLALGLRRGEALGLRWKDINLDAATLQVAVNLQLIGGKLVLVAPKTKESQRTLPMPPSLVAVLHAHHARQLQERMFAGRRWQDHGLVFCTSIGTPIAPRNLLRSLHTLLERNDLPRMRFHDLRHSCASLLAAQGVGPKVAQELLGHSDIRTTLAIYTHVSDDQKRQATETMDRLLHVDEEKRGTK